MTITNLAHEQSQPKPNNEVKHSFMTPEELAAYNAKVPMQKKRCTAYTVSQEKKYRIGQR